MNGTIRKVKVRSMVSPNGHKVANQFEIDTEEGTYFQSYNTIIVAVVNGVTYLDERSWDYSVTTGKYRNMFLGEKKADTLRKIKTGEYILKNLN